MTLNEAVKRVKLYSHRGDQSVTTDQTTSDIVLAINDARRELLRRLPKRFFWKMSATPLAFTSGDNDYDLASDVQEPIRFWFTTGGSRYFLTKVDSDHEWHSRHYDPNASNGRPTHYREINNGGTKAIQVAPTPDGSYSVYYEYYKNVPTALTTSNLSSEIPDLPDYLHDAVWKGALYMFLKAFDDPAAGMAQADYARAIAEYDASDEEDHDTEIAFRFGNATRPNNTLGGF